MKEAIKEFRPNEIYASQWIEMMMKQALEYDEKIDILAEPTLTELIDNNKYVLENKIDQKIVQNFVDLLI